MASIQNASGRRVAGRPPIRRRAAGVTAAVAVVGLSAATARAGLVPGDLLLCNFQGNNVQQYSPAGTLRQQFSTGDGDYEGAAAAVMPSGLVATTFRTGAGTFTPGVALFRPDGTLATSFSLAAVTVIPGDLSAFADGTLAVNNQGTATGGVSVELYTQAGVHVRSLTVAGMRDPFGSTVAPDGTLWVTDLYADALYHFAEAGTLLGTVKTAFAPGDLVVSPTDGTLYVTDQSAADVQHLSATGTVLGSFATAVPTGQFDGIAQADDGSLYVESVRSSAVYHYAATGTPLGSFPITSPNSPLFLGIVPDAVPEPATAALLTAAAAAGLGRRRTRR